MEQFESVLLASRPDAVIVYGDTNSTIAGALVAAKLRIPVAHVEAGLRSFNRAMAEEINRIATDHVSDLLFAPTPTAMKWLEREGLAARSHFTGDIGYDAVLHFGPMARRKSRILQDLELRPGSFTVLTVHRSENASAAAIRAVVAGLLEELEPEQGIVFPIHPRTIALLREHGEALPSVPRLKVIKPVGFLDMLQLVANASIVLTDSGGSRKRRSSSTRPASRCAARLNGSRPWRQAPTCWWAWTSMLSARRWSDCVVPARQGVRTFRRKSSRCLEMGTPQNEYSAPFCNSWATSGVPGTFR